MRSASFFFGMGLALALSGIAFAADPSASTGRPNEIAYNNVAGPAEIPSAPDGDDTMVCNYQRDTGSLLTSRICRTLRAWKKMQADSREFFEFQHLGSHQKQGD